MRRRHAWTIGATALGVMLLAACSAGEKSVDLAADDPKAAMAAAAKRTTAAKTVRIAMSATSAGDVKVVSGTGSYDFTTQRGRFTLQTTLGGSVEVVFSPTEAYVKVPPRSPGGPNWIRVGDNPQSSQLFASIREQADPRVTLDAIGANLPDLEKVGTQKVRDVDTTHLRGRVDLSDAAIARAAASRREGLRAAQEAFGEDGYPIDVWLDAQGRVRRVQYEISRAAAGPQSRVELRYDLYDFGKVPGIELPAATDVGDAPSVVSSPTTAGK